MSIKAYSFFYLTLQKLQIGHFFLKELLIIIIIIIIIIAH